MHVSIVIPVYNEEGNLPVLVEELGRLRAWQGDLEVVVVDDGSNDRTGERIEALRREHAFLAPIRLPERRGQSAALLAGLRAARGEILVTLDGDLQNDPADVPRLVDALGDADVVCGYRARRQDRLSRRLGSRAANRVRNWVTRDGIRDTGCSLKAFRRPCLDDLPPLQGVHRFMPAYFKLCGRDIREIPVNHRPRRHGRSKYTNLGRLPATLLDLFGFWWYRRRHLRLP